MRQKSLGLIGWIIIIALLASCSLETAATPTPDLPGEVVQSSPTIAPTPAPPTASPSPEPTGTPTPEPSPTPNPTPTPALPPPASAPGETWTRSTDGMEMVYVPAGDFNMGSTEAEIDLAFEFCEQDRYTGACARAWFEDEAPAHVVALDAFWLDRTEVTNAQFAAFLNDQGNQIEGEAFWLELADADARIESTNNVFQPRAGYENHPATEVTWYGGRAYCQWAGGVLPNEEHWEYAARGPAGLRYPWGDAAPDCNLANSEGCQQDTQEVGSLPAGASWSGAVDMAGNVWEWVSDWYLPFEGSEYDHEDFGQQYKIIRGGSWNLEPYYMRTAQRNLVYFPHISFEHIGFRCMIPAVE